MATFPSLTISYDTFKSTIEGFSKRAEEIITSNVSSEGDLIRFNSESKEWLTECLRFIKDSFSEPNNSFVRGFIAGPDGFSIPGNFKRPWQDETNLERHKMTNRRNNLIVNLNLVGACDLIRPKALNNELRASYSIRQKSDYILQKLYDLNDIYYYPISILAEANGLVLRTKTEAFELGKRLEGKGLINTIGGAGSEISGKITLDGSIYVEENLLKHSEKPVENTNEFEAGLIDENYRLSDLTVSNVFFESRLSELANRLTVSSQFLSEAQFVKEEIERLRNIYLKPAKMTVDSAWKITREFNFDKYTGYAYDTLRSGHNPTVMSIVKAADSEYQSVFADQPDLVSHMRNKGTIENSVVVALKAGAGYLLYDKFLSEKLEQQESTTVPKELIVSDVREFARVKDFPLPSSPDQMRDISEASFKECLGELFGDQTAKDWGGEMCDYYTAHAHFGERQISCAFLLKGKADFSPMKLTHLGKNRDQINRLAKVEADVIIVQHSHDITPEVRETLKAFALLESKRWYCFIDGRDSLRILLAYNLFDKTIKKTTT
jgi:hypothetical protein